MERIARRQQSADLHKESLEGAMEKFTSIHMERQRQCGKKLLLLAEGVKVRCEAMESRLSALAATLLEARQKTATSDKSRAQQQRERHFEPSDQSECLDDLEASPHHVSEIRCWPDTQTGPATMPLGCKQISRHFLMRR